VRESSTIQHPQNATAKPAERRAWVRFPCDLESACHPLAGTQSLQWPGKVCNLSRGGIALALGRRFEVGTVLAIDVQGKLAETGANVLARVVHVKVQSDGSWLLGCAFTKPLSEDDLQKLL
jgi:hypothetical protein